jgi:hypothetical protein
VGGGISKGSNRLGVAEAVNDLVGKYTKIGRTQADSVKIHRTKIKAKLRLCGKGGDHSSGVEGKV